jgi:hypothetical protein
MPTSNDHQDEHGNVMFILGEIKGQIAGFIAGQAAQDSRIAIVETKVDTLVTKVSLIAAAIGAGSGYATQYLH